MSTATLHPALAEAIAAADDDDPLTELLARRAQAWFGRVPARFRDANLDGLTTDQQPDDIRSWLTNDNARHLFLVGPVGAGKTYAAYAALNQAAVQAIVTRTKIPDAWTVPGLLDAIRPTREGTEDATWERAKACPLLLLDDLANVRPTDWAIERMWMLADARTGADLRTVITTNAAWVDLENAWGIATMDRFRDRSVIVKIAGESLRKPAW